MDRCLERYRKTLPKLELLALEAWTSTFYPFQKNWLFEPAQLSLCVKARQIGISHTTSAVGVLWGAFHGELTTIVSIGDRESSEVLEKAKRHALVLERLGSRMARITKFNKNEISFGSGGRVLALPSSGGRGFTGNVFLDEYAYQEHAGDVWDAAAAVTMLGGKMRVASTPNGVGNDFHNLWERAHLPASGWTAHAIKLSDALAEGYPVDEKVCWELAKGDPRLFDQLFNCAFLDGQMQYVPTEAINACSVDSLASSEGEHYAGLDIGRDADLTVLIVVRVVRGIRYVVHVESMKRTDSDGLEKMVARAFARFKLRRLCIDATGLGTFPAERIKKQHSERIETEWRRPRVECVTFTPTVKEDLATGLYTAMTGATVRIPKTDASLPGCEKGTAEDLRKDIASIRRIITTAGNVRYDAPRTAKGHADRAWSLALALHACSAINPMREALAGR